MAKFVHKGGFTIIELLIVAAVIAIIAAIIIPAISGKGTYAQNYNQYIANQIVYFKDERTGICYARDNQYHRYGDGIIGQVDCEKVKRELQ